VLFLPHGFPKKGNYGRLIGAWKWVSFKGKELPGTRCVSLNFLSVIQIRPTPKWKTNLLSSLFIRNASSQGPKGKVRKGESDWTFSIPFHLLFLFNSIIFISAKTVRFLNPARLNFVL